MFNQPATSICCILLAPSLIGHSQCIASALTCACVSCLGIPYTPWARPTLGLADDSRTRTNAMTSVLLNKKRKKESRNLVKNKVDIF